MRDYSWLTVQGMRTWPVDHLARPKKKMKKVKETSCNDRNRSHIVFIRHGGRAAGRKEPDQ